MINNISLSNFRIFKEEQGFTLKPITILVGPNNSGKSSLFKAINFLQDNLSEGVLIPMIFRFDLGSSMLGDFIKASNNSKGNCINFSFDFGWGESRYTISFSIEDDKTSTHNGRLKYFEVRDSKEKNPVFNFSITYNDFRRVNSIDYFANYLYFKKKYEKDSNEHGEVWYNPNIPLFNYIKLNEREYANFETTYLLDVSKGMCHPDDSMDLFGEFLINNDNKHNLTFMNMSKFKEYTNITPTSNGALFFNQIGKELKKIIEGGINDFNSINCISKFQLNQNRFYFENGTPENRILVAYLSNLTIKKSRNWQSRGDFEATSVHKDFKREHDDFINFWLIKFGIMSKDQILDVKRHAESVTVIRIIDKKTKDEVRNLADLGSGISRIIFLLFDIVVSERYSKICLEEPEANLHPDFQSLLADLLVDAHMRFEVSFLVETHSECLIREMQCLIAERKLTVSPYWDANIYFFNKRKMDEDIQAPFEINFNSNGSLTRDFGSGFVDEATNRILKLWKTQSLN